MNLTTSLFTSSFNSLYVEIFLLISITLLILYSVIFEKKKNIQYILLSNIYKLSILILLISIILIFENPFNNLITFNNTFILDYFTLNIKLIILLSTIIVLVISIDYLNKKHIYSYEYFFLILFSITAMMLLSSSFDLLSIYITIELQSLCFYILASIKRNSEYSTEAGFKYFILGAFASGFILLGFAILYGLLGVTNLEYFLKIITSIHNNSEIESVGTFVAIILIAVGMLFKIGAVPFHMWLPDVYEGSPTSVTAFFAIIPKIVIISLFFRLFLYTFYDFMNDSQYLFIISSIISMSVASLAALYQHKIKRLFAYSAIGHTGYMLMGISTGTLEGIQSVFMYVIIYMIMSISIFTIVLSLRNQKNKIQLKYIEDLIGLSKINPILSITIAVVLFSMAGIPPLAGFFSKFFIFLCAINSSLYLLAIVGILTSIISCIYYIYIIKIMYFDKTNYWTLLEPMTKNMSIILGISTLIILLFFINPSILVNYSHIIALSFII